MHRHLITLAVTVAVALGATAAILAQGHITRHGRAIVEYRSADVVAVGNYEYSQRHHDGAWLLIEFAIQATPRIAIHRREFLLIGPDERAVPLASQAEFLADQPALNRLMQNAKVWRRSFDSYFTSRPMAHTIKFFASPGGTISDSVVTNLDEVATGDLLFKSPDGRWGPGTYRLVLNHEQVKADLPITLQ